MIKLMNLNFKEVLLMVRPCYDKIFITFIFIFFSMSCRAYTSGSLNHLLLYLIFPIYTYMFVFAFLKK